MAEPSWQDLWDVFKASAQNARPTLTFDAGSVADAIAAGTASASVVILARVANRFLANFLDGSFGEDLISLSHDRGVDADLGSSAIGAVTFSRASAAFGAGTIPKGSRVATESDDNTGLTITVKTDEDVVFGALDLTKTVSATAIAVGKSGNVIEDSLTRIIDGVFDPSITVINSERFTGGSEQEGDQDLRDRVRGFFLTQARATVEALEFGARTVPGVRRVSVVVDDAGIITVYVADEDGSSNTTMTKRVADALKRWKAASDVVNVSPGVLTNVDIVLSITVRTGVAIEPLLDRIRNSVVSRVGRLNPGETLFRDAITSAVRDVDKEAITGVEVISPAANITPNVGEVIRTTTSRVSFQ